jgi:uncharacterized protein with HEPN domain
VRGDRDRILDMLEMCDLLIAHASNERELAEDPVIQAAAQRWIEVLGEAASRLSDDVKLAHPDVAWREIAGIRVILAHAYFHVEHDVIGQLVTDDVPLLRLQLQQIVDSLPPSGD